jgi:hypothetical protein
MTGKLNAETRRRGENIFQFNLVFFCTFAFLH